MVALLAENGVSLAAAIEEGLALAGYSDSADLAVSQRSGVADVVALGLIGTAKDILRGAVAEAGAGPAKARFESRLASLESIERQLQAKVGADVPTPCIAVIRTAV